MRKHFLASTFLLAVLLLPLVATLPVFANTGIGANGGTCTTAGAGTAFGPTTKSFVSTNGTGTITYVIERECLVKGAAGGSTSASVVYKVNATCTGVCPADAGTIGSLTVPGTTCNKPALCTTSSVAAGAGTILLTNTALTILSGSAALVSLPAKGSNTVAHLGTVTINVPATFSAVAPDFSIAFKA